MRLAVLVLSRICLTWNLTVPSEMNSSLAILALVNP